MDQIIINNFFSFSIAILLLIFIHNFSVFISKNHKFDKSKIINYVISANIVLIGLALSIFILFSLELEISLIRTFYLIIILYIFFKSKFSFKNKLSFNKFEYLFLFFSSSIHVST